MLSATEPAPPVQPSAAPTTRCLILACGNPLRGDDGVGPHLAEWAEEHFRDNNEIRVLARHQFTPELAAEISSAESVLFLDSSINSEPGRVSLIAIGPLTSHQPATHHLSASQLLALARSLYGAYPAHAMLISIGAASIELGTALSAPVQSALPRAQGLLVKAVEKFLEP